MGFFDRKQLPYGMGEGYDMPPEAALMQQPGMGVDTALPEDQFAAQRPEHGGFFGKVGGFLNKNKDNIREIGAIMMAGGDGPGKEAGLQSMKDIAEARNPRRLPNDDTPAMREAGAMGYRPGTPQFNDYVRRARFKPTFMMMGNPENGQQIVNPEEMGGGSAPEVGEEQDGYIYLGGDPSLATSWRQR